MKHDVDAGDGRAHQCYQYLSFLSHSLLVLFMARFERVRAVTINTLSNHLFRFVSGRKWEQTSLVNRRGTKSIGWSSHLESTNGAEGRNAFHIIQMVDMGRTAISNRFPSLNYADFSLFCFLSLVRWWPAGISKHPELGSGCVRVWVLSVLFHPFLIVFTFVMTRIKCPCAMFGLVSRISRTVVHISIHLSMVSGIHVYRTR